jgi:mitogen-activated protein kinase 15
LSLQTLTIKTYGIPLLDAQYSIGEYRDRLYMEIVKRKKELRKAQKEREAARAAARPKSRSASYHSSSGGTSAYGASAYTHAAAAVRH